MTNPTIQDAPLKAAVVAAALDFLRRTGTGAFCVRTGTPGQMVMAGEAPALRRLLGMGELKDLLPGELLGYQTSHFLAAAGIPPDRKADYTGREWKLFMAGFELAARLADRLPAVQTDTQQYRTGYGDGVRAAAKLCDEKYQARVESGHPREASAAHSLAEAIRDLQSTAPAAAPVAAAGLRVTLRGSGSHMPLDVWGEECLAGEFGAFRFAVHHRLWHDTLGVESFTVTSLDAGYSVGHGDSIEEAIANARANLKTITLEEFGVRVERAKEEEGLPPVSTDNQQEGRRG